MNVFGKYSDENLSFCKKFHVKMMVSGQRKVESCPIQAFQHFFPKKRKLLKKIMKQHFIVIAKQLLLLRQLLLNFLLEIIAPKKKHDYRIFTL